MKRRLFRARLAELDLTEHVDHLARENPSAARRFIDATERAFDRLSEMPEIGRLQDFDHPALCAVRLWPIPGFTKYLIFYQITQDELRVLRVLHGARDIPSLLEFDSD